MPLDSPKDISSVEEVLHGTTVRDPYRWLEDRTLPRTEAWIREQQHRCDAYFTECPGLRGLEHRVRKYLDFEVVDQPARIANRYFYRKRRKSEEQACIYVRDIATGEERVLFDPSDQGSFTSVGIHRIAEDGKLLAFEIKRGGEDRTEIHIVDVDSGQLLADSVPRGYSRGFAFTEKGDGYVYAQETDSLAEDHNIRLHTFGQQGEDEILFHVPHGRGSKLVLIANASRFGAIWLRPYKSRMISDFFTAPKDSVLVWRKVFSEKWAPYNPLLCHDKIFVLIETESKSSKLVEISTDGEQLGTLIPEAHTPIRQLAVTRDRIYVSYLERGLPRIETWNFVAQRQGSVDLPAGGTVQILPGHTQMELGFFYSVESYDTPLTIYEYNSTVSTSSLWYQPDLLRTSQPLKTREACVVSKDDIRVPLTLVGPDSHSPNRPGPMIMTSYGGFGVAMTPKFSAFVTIMIELGAIFAIAHVRGGGEFDTAWHDAGRARNRQRSIDDFLASAEWLRQQGLTTPSQLGIFGGSNSGLLVGAALTQQPELFGAVLCIAPLLDMVRYESFDQAFKWRPEFGTVEDEKDFHALFGYSPYHHILEDIDYPATMFVSGDKDERCNPAHVRKMAAYLQERIAQTKPIIVDYAEERGHSPVLPLSVRISALARRIAFLCRELNIPLHEGEADETPRS